MAVQIMRKRYGGWSLHKTKAKETTNCGLSFR